MPTKDFTTILLEMEDTEVENIEYTSKTIVVQLHLKRKTHVCFHCGTRTNKVHDYRTQIVKDLPVLGKTLIWLLRKRRYRCTCCGKRFPEKNCLLPKHHRITNCLALYCMQQLGSRRSLNDIAASVGVSPSSVNRWLKLKELFYDFMSSDNRQGAARRLYEFWLPQFP